MDCTISAARRRVGPPGAKLDWLLLGGGRRSWPLWRAPRLAKRVSASCSTSPADQASSRGGAAAGLRGLVVAFDAGRKRCMVALARAGAVKANVEQYRI